MPKIIRSFSGPNRFLSNFFPSPIQFEGRNYGTVEHAYQAAKTLDKEVKEKIAKAKTPGDAKSLGRKVKLRPDWEEVKLSIMYELVLSKFQTHTELALQLLTTGASALEEGNTWGDRFWGKVSGVGENHLGKILMQVREEIGATNT